MQTLVTIVHVMVCLFLMLTVLLQAGKDGGMGAAFGGGSSTGTVFGGSGASNFLRKLTVASAVIFMLTSMTLAWMATPSTDPLKDYWSKQEQAKAAREKAHEQALSNGPTTGADKNDGADKDKSSNTPENSSPVDTGDQGGATAPADGSKAPADGSKAPADGSKAPADGSKAPATSKPAATKPAATKPAATKPATATRPAAGKKPPVKPAGGDQQPAAP